MSSIDTARRAAAKAKEKHGAESHEHAAALFELAKRLMADGDLVAALDPLREAAAIRGPGNQATKDRLTYAMNLGEILERVGRVDEAETVLRANLEERKSFYGEQHPGYAYGLEALANVLRAKQDFGEAIMLVNQAVKLFFDDGNKRIAGAFATRSTIVIALGGKAFSQVGSIPDDVFIEMADDVIARGGVDDARLHMLALSELLEVTHTRLGAGSEPELRVIAALTNAARVIGAHEARIDALTMLLERFDARNDRVNALQAVQGLALAYDEAKRPDDADATYRDAVRRAEALKDAAALSSVARNYGIFLADTDREKGRPWLERAVAEAKRAKDASLQARAEIALGIQLQHAGDLAGARPLLARALAVLPPASADALCARSHLDAIETNASCGCGDMGGAVAGALRALVMKDLPEGLVRDVRVTLDEGKVQFGIELAREATQAELELVDRAVRAAQAELRKNAAR